jgi:hypothetical protein
MAAEVMGSALRRLGVEPTGDAMRQFAVDDHREQATPITLVERPPVASFRAGRADVRRSLDSLDQSEVSLTSRRSDIGSS